MRARTVLFAVLILAASFAGATVGMQWLWPSSPSDRADRADRTPALAETPPLPPVTRSSVIIAPTSISLAALRDAMERDAPREFSGKRDNPFSQFLSNGEITWTATRGPLALNGKPDALVASTAVNGTVRATGQLSPQAAGSVGSALSGLLGQDVGRSIERLAGRNIDQRADVRGSVTVMARPAITPAWRFEPNLSAQVSVSDANLSLAGARLNVASEVKPALERAVKEQLTALAARLRNDPVLEAAAHREWTKLCRSVPLGTAAAGLPKLWLEVKPTRAFAAQPRIDAQAMVLTLGVEAETRISPIETKPNCPFPSTLELVPHADEGRVSLAVPIDVPFPEVNRLIAAKLVGTSIKRGPFDATIRAATLAASGDRLLLSLRVTPNQKNGWFGAAGEATVHVWGRPMLDRERQQLRLTDVALDVESESALVDAAARAAAPLLQTAVAEHAVVDLQPFAANARRSIEAAMADFRTSRDGIRVDAAVSELRLTEIAFDSLMLRVIAEADGSASVEVTSLPQAAQRR